MKTITKAQYLCFDKNHDHHNEVCVKLQNDLSLFFETSGMDEAKAVVDSLLAEGKEVTAAWGYFAVAEDGSLMDHQFYPVH